MMIETWRKIDNYPLYEISDLGRVLSFARGVPHILVGVPDGTGYPTVVLRRKGSHRRYKVHRLVCEYFHGPPPTPRHQVAHIDGSKTNSNALNLRWALPAENTRDKIRHGTHQSGERHPRAKLTTSDVAEIRRRVSLGEQKIAVAAFFGIHNTTVGQIVRRERWRKA